VLSEETLRIIDLQGRPLGALAKMLLLFLTCDAAPCAVALLVLHT
jgi:hypothetical protein